MTELQKAKVRSYNKYRWLFDKEFRRKHQESCRQWEKSENGQAYRHGERYKSLMRKYKVEYNKLAKMKAWRREYMKTWRQTPQGKAATKRANDSKRQKEWYKLYVKDYWKEYGKLDKYKELARHGYHKREGKKKFYENCSRCQRETKINFRPERISHTFG